MTYPERKDQQDWENLNSLNQGGRIRTRSALLGVLFILFLVGLLTWDFNRRPEPGQQVGSNTERSTTETPQTPVRPAP